MRASPQVAADLEVLSDGSRQACRRASHQKLPCPPAAPIEPVHGQPRRQRTPMPPSTLPSRTTGDRAMALSFDPATHHNILKVVRVAWIASPKVAPRPGNEATKRAMK